MRRSASELIDTKDPAWPVICQAVAAASTLRPISLPPAFTASAELEALQITTRSTLGALAYHSGGLILADGWLRVLGSGHPDLPFSITTLSAHLGWSSTSDTPRAIAIGFDVLGGIFAINWGELSTQGFNQVFYFAPDSLRWEPLNIGHSEWLDAMLNANVLDNFYADFRWPGWQEEITSLPPTHGLSIYPPLCTKESRPISNTSRRAVPYTELWSLLIDIAKQLDPPQ